MKVEEHKHLGIILDSKLTFSAHIKSAISKSRKGIGLLKYLSKYLPRHILNELYKLYVRPHLDYGDVIYHIPAKVCQFSGSIVLPNLMEKLESVQYSAARAITGAWRRTSREKLYTELGWESLSCRRWCRRLTSFFKIIIMQLQFTPRIQSRHFNHHITLFATGMLLGDLRPEQKNSNLVSILIAYQNGMNLILRSDLYHPLRFFRRSFHQ